MKRGVRMRKFRRCLTDPYITYYNMQLCEAWSLGIGYPASEQRAINSLKYAILVGEVKATAETIRESVRGSLFLATIQPLEIISQFFSWLKNERYK